MAIKDENYILIQGYMINKLKLSGNKLLVYAIIDGFSQEENCWYEGNLNYLCEFINCKSKTTISNILKELVEKELILKEEKTINNVKFCKYRTVYQKMDGISKNDTNTVSKIGTNNTIYINNKRNIKESLKNEDNFELLWKLYPKKVGKSDALRHYTKAVKEGTSFEDIRKGIIKYNEHIKNSKTEYKYIKDGSTWFNKHCWEDEYEVIPKKEERRII